MDEYGNGANAPMSQQSDFQGFLAFSMLDRLLSGLQAKGYRCMGPTVEQGAIIFGELLVATELPRGLQVVQSPSQYTLTSDPQNRYFAWVNGPQAIKPLTFAPRESLWRVQRDELGGLKFESVAQQPIRTALIGVRACDLAALALQDAHFLREPNPDAHYAARRNALFLVAVQCAEPAATCFCASTGDGPTPQYGFDLSLTELANGFVVTSGSAAGAEILAELDLEAATTEQLQAAREQGELAASRQQRSLPGRDLRPLLMSRLEHRHWDEVAARCLSCGNCTAVCPTCFCHTQNDEVAPGAGETTHVREWDSCFNAGHAYLHGHNVRPDTKSRYRQWLIHKLATWHDQYGRSGCVGCGRCISWCPAAIDLTEEVAALAKGGEGDQ